MDEVIVKQVPSERVAVVHVSASFDRIGERIRQALQLLGAQVGDEAGMPFLVTQSIDEVRGEGEFDVCWPCEQELDGEGVSVVEMPGGRMISTIHEGPYAEVGPAYRRVEEWIAEHGLRHAGPPREVYLNDPLEAGEEHARTEILMPVA